MAGVKQFLLMIGLVALVGCGKKQPVQPSAFNTEPTKPEKETGKEATQTTTPNPEATKPEPTKSKAAAGVKLWEFETGSHVTRRKPCHPIQWRGRMAQHLPFQIPIA